MLEVLKYEGIVAIATQGEIEPHIVNTWNSYIEISNEGSILIPAGRMNITEENLEKNNKVFITIGSKEVEGFHSMGTGFLISGTGNILAEGKEFDIMKEKFPWMRAVLVVKIDNITQTLQKF